MVLILRRLAEIKRKEHDVKRSCPPVCFSCAFIFIQATCRLHSVCFGLFVPSKPAELWPLFVQTQQGVPPDHFLLSFRFSAAASSMLTCVFFPSLLLRHAVLRVSA